MYFKVTPFRTSSVRTKRDRGLPEEAHVTAKAAMGRISDAWLMFPPKG